MKGALFLFIATQLSIGTGFADVPTWISPSALIDEVKDVKIYEEIVHLVFPLPDIMDPVPLKQFKDCDKVDRFEGLLCHMAKNIGDTNFQTQKQISTMQKSFTLNGISSMKYEVPKVDIEEIVPDGSDFDARNDPWYRSWTAALKDRALDTPPFEKARNVKRATSEDSEFFTNYNSFDNTTRSGREERAAQLAMAKSIFALFGKKSLGNMFLPKQAVLRSLFKMVKELPKAFRHFLDVPKFQSEFTVIQKEGAKLVESNSNRFESIIIPQSKDKPTVKDLASAQLFLFFLLQQSSLVASSTTMTISQSFIFDSCRSGYIPMFVLPPQVLKNRLLQLEKETRASNDNLELIYSSEETMVYYELPMAECKFDNDGGVIAVKIPIKRRDTSYKMYKHSGFPFQYGEKTCEISMPSGYVIQDEKSSSLYTVSSLDAENCKPDTSPICRLPRSANANVQNYYCLSTLMSGGSALEIKSACPITCRKGTRTTTVQLDEDTLMIAHLPRSGTKIICEDKAEKEVIHDLDVGAVRLTLGCGCSIFFEDKLIGKSLQTHCQKEQPFFAMEYSIPVPLTKMDNWIPQVKDGFRGMQFKGKVDTIPLEIFHEEKDSGPKFGKIPKYLWVYMIGSPISTVFQWILILTIFCRQRQAALNYGVPAGINYAIPLAGVAQVAHGSPIRSDADGKQTEEIITEYIILAVIALYCVPLILHKAYKTIRDSYDNTVRTAATQMVAFSN